MVNVDLSSFKMHASLASRTGNTTDIENMKSCEKELDPEALKEAIKENDYELVRTAARGGYTAVLEYFKEKAPDLIPDMMKANTHELFFNVLQNQKVALLFSEFMERDRDLLLAEFYDNPMLLSLTQLKLLAEKYPEKTKEIVENNDYEVFQKLATAGRIGVISHLAAQLKLGEKEFGPILLNANQGRLLNKALKSININHLEYFMAIAKDDFLKMIRANGYQKVIQQVLNQQVPNDETSPLLEFFKKNLPEDYAQIEKTIKNHGLFKKNLLELKEKVGTLEKNGHHAASVALKTYVTTAENARDTFLQTGDKRGFQNTLKTASLAAEKSELGKNRSNSFFGDILATIRNMLGLTPKSIEKIRNTWEVVKNFEEQKDSDNLSPK